MQTNNVICREEEKYESFLTALKKFFITLIMIIWQLPQDILGFLVWLTLRHKYKKPIFTTEPSKFYFSTNRSWGVCLGHFIIINKEYDRWVLKHENGHQKQSKMLGPLYLLLIGIPSALGNLRDKYFHTYKKGWTIPKRRDWYYKQPWEKWANKLSNIGYNIETNKFTYTTIYGKVRECKYYELYINTVDTIKDTISEITSYDGENCRVAYYLPEFENCEKLFEKIVENNFGAKYENMKFYGFIINGKEYTYNKYYSIVKNIFFKFGDELIGKGLYVDCKINSSNNKSDSTESVLDHFNINNDNASVTTTDTSTNENKELIVLFKKNN